MTEPHDSNEQKLTMQQVMGKPKLSTRQIRAQEILAYIFKKMQPLQHAFDRFISFVSKPQDSDRNDVVQAARSPILFGFYIIIIFVGIGGLWSVIAPLNSAVVAIGTVISSSNKKIIQHHEGGIIKNIFVTQGDEVKEGDKLIELEDAKIKSQYENILNQYRTSLAMESRLISERDNLETIEFPEFLKQSRNIPEVEKIMHTQDNLFRYHKEVYRAEKESLKQKVIQLNKQIEGLEARKIAANKHLAIISDRLKAVKTLKDKGFAAKSAVLDLEIKEASDISDVANIETEIAKVHQEIIRVEIENINIENKYIAEVLTHLKDAQEKTANHKENYIALTDALKRIVIKSPVDGVVNAINKHTIGGVVGSGETIIEISPTNDNLIIEAKVPHKNIDSVHVGLTAKIRFSAFKSRTTPLFTGKVVSVSPDIVQDKTLGANPNDTYYIARIEIDMEEFNRIGKAKKLELHPGMQSEVQIVTGTRTVLRYLLDPVADTMFRAFREK